MKLDAQAERVKNHRKIDIYVKQHLFKRLKFYNNNLMKFNKNPYSVCQKVLKAMNVVDAEKEVFWENYCPAVQSSIRNTRNDVVGAMKLSFFNGKSPMHPVTLEFL